MPWWYTPSGEHNRLHKLLSGVAHAASVSSGQLDSVAFEIEHDAILQNFASTQGFLTSVCIELRLKLNGLAH